jgi:ketosteroid isomerase-like protein
MSQADVDVVLDQYDAVNERDFERAMSHYAEEVELVVPPSAEIPGAELRGGMFKGRDAVGEWFGDWFRSFRDIRFEMTELSELGEGVVLVVAEHSARGRASGVEVHGTVVWVYWLGDGKVVRLEAFESRDKAREAARH